jgi:hypothetical protein
LRPPSRGEVPEWSIGAVSKTVVPCEGHRGFESHPLRQVPTLAAETLKVAEIVDFSSLPGNYGGELRDGCDDAAYPVVEG